MKRVAALLTVVLSISIAFAGDPPPPSKELLAQGKAVYEGSVGCHACHGVNGDGKGPVAFALNPAPRNFRQDAFKAGDRVEQIFATITNGLPNTKMTAYGTVPEADRWALAYYVQSFRPRPAAK